MARTYRKFPESKTSWSTSDSFRKVRTTRTKKQEMAAYQELVEEGFTPNPRLAARANIHSDVIPNARDEIYVGSWDQTPKAKQPKAPRLM